MSDETRAIYIWWDERLQQITTMQMESHARLRADMERFRTEMNDKFEDVFKQARAISERTLVIETERSMERRAGMKVGAIYGAMAGAATAAIVNALIRAFWVTGP